MKRTIAAKVCMIASMIFIMSVPISARAEIQTGGVQIHLECLEENENGFRKLFQKKPELVPQENHSYIISVSNQGAEAWVRLKLDYVQEQEGDCNCVKVDDTWIDDIGENWIKKGDYWYCLEPLKKGETVDFCKGIQVPDIEDLPNGLRFEIHSQAEAVQAESVHPDFSSDNPFSGIYVADFSTVGVPKEEVSGFRVSFENSADTIVETDRLFSNVTSLMPGEAVREIVTIQNKNPYVIQIVLKENGSVLDDLLIKVIRLTIERDGKRLYDGSLTDDSIRNGLDLGVYDENSVSQLVFTLGLSETAKNNTAFRTLDVELIFDVEKKESVSMDSDWVLDKSNRNSNKSETAKQMYSFPDPSIEKGYVGGKWRMVDVEKMIWEYYFADGSQAKNGWLYLYNPYSQDEDKNGWFCFDEKGIMQYGWIREEDEKWYFCHERSDGNLGRLKKEWHYDLDDKKIYYLDPITGIMQTGWREIQGNYYYFTPLSETKRQNWFWKTSIGRWIYDYLGFRTYGSMFKGERTPDGYLVGEDGVWDGKDANVGGR